jgi:hypothetical protein
LFLRHKKERYTAKYIPIISIFELVWTMLGIGRAENQSFQPVAPLVWVKEFPSFSHSPADSGCDSGVWAGIRADFGNGPAQSTIGTKTRSDPQ